MTRQKQPLRRRILEAAAIVVLLPILLPLVALALLLFTFHRAILYMLVWLLWLPKGKDALFVYSDSPTWHGYMTQQVFPLLEERAVVLNWSQRSKWRKWRLTEQVFYSFSGRHSFNPMVIMFRPLRRAKLFRFWSAFEDWKHGHTEQVEQLTNQLRMSL